MRNSLITGFIMYVIASFATPFAQSALLNVIETPRVTPTWTGTPVPRLSVHLDIRSMSDAGGTLFVRGDGQVEISSDGEIEYVADIKMYGQPLLGVRAGTPTMTPTPEGKSRVAGLQDEADPVAIVRSLGSNVHLREGPGTQHAIISKHRPGEQLDLMGRTANGAWYQLCCGANDRIGWMSGNYLDIRGNQADVEVVRIGPALKIAPAKIERTPIATPHYGFALLSSKQGAAQLPTIYAWIHDQGKPIGNQTLRVLLDGKELSHQGVSEPQTRHTWGINGQRQRLTNLKLEFPTLKKITGGWTIQLMSAGSISLPGIQGMGPPITFQVNGKASQEMYIEYGKIGATGH